VQQTRIHYYGAHGYVCLYVCIYQFPATVVHLLLALSDASAPLSNANIQRSPATTVAARSACILCLQAMMMMMMMI
jgi:hypothetical protein